MLSMIFSSQIRGGGAGQSVMTQRMCCHFFCRAILLQIANCDTRTGFFTQSQRLKCLDRPRGAINGRSAQMLPRQGKKKMKKRIASAVNAKSSRKKKMVRIAGLEPARIAPLPPQSSVSANSTICAQFSHSLERLTVFRQLPASNIWPCSATKFLASGRSRARFDTAPLVGRLLRRRRSGVLKIGSSGARWAL